MVSDLEGKETTKSERKFRDRGSDEVVFGCSLLSFGSAVGSDFFVAIFFLRSG